MDSALDARTSAVDKGAGRWAMMRMKLHSSKTLKDDRWMILSMIDDTLTNQDNRCVKYIVCEMGNFNK